MGMVAARKLIGMDGDKEAPSWPTQTSLSIRCGPWLRILAKIPSLTHFRHKLRRLTFLQNFLSALISQKNPTDRSLSPPALLVHKENDTKKKGKTDFCKTDSLW